MMHNGFGAGFGQYGNWLCGPGMFFPGPLGWVVTILFWGLIIYLVVRLVQFLVHRGNSSTSHHMDVLKERYARGEIDRDEYQRLKSELLS